MAVTPDPATPPPDNPLTTKEGWARWVHQPTSAPELHPGWRELPAAERAAYDEARLDHHSDLIVVNTPTIREVITTVRRLLVLNRRQISARRGLIVSGGGGTGKTTAITQLGRAHGRVRPLPRPPVHRPAQPARHHQRRLRRALRRPLRLSPVDEIHNLNLATRAGAEVSDQLKYFSERIPATFDYAGINLARANLFTGTRGEQIASRFATIPTKSFAHGFPAQHETWRALVATLEQALRLHQHRPGTLARHGEYLHQRTHGMIGSLSHLIRSAAVDAILGGTEKITKAHIEAILLDHAVETGQAAGPKKRAPRRAGVA